MTIASDMTSMFPVVLHLSPKGKGVRSPFPQGGLGAVRCPKLQVLGWGLVVVLDRAGGCCESPA